MRIGLGVGVTDVGTQGGVSDAADGSILALILLDAELNGLAIDFRDLSYAIRTTSAAEMLLGSEAGLAADFTDLSYAVRS